jgi:pimeloyl-ACP methyl ester carboxylesterase
VNDPRIDTTIVLPDGRRLSYAEYGEASGQPVFLFHGNPGSRFEWMRVADPATMRGVRAIAPDRPGFGRSDFQPGRTHLDWAGDVAALADTLGIDRFSIIAFSSGGAHGIACALELSARVDTLGLISCVAPLDVPRAFEGMTAANTRDLKLARWSSALSRVWTAWVARRSVRDAQGRVDQASDTSEQDKQAANLKNMTEAYRQGGLGVAYELTLRSRPWAFDPTCLTTRTFMWQGESDDNVPVSMGRYWARTLPNCEAAFIPEARHALHGRRMSEIVSKVMGRTE